MRVLHSALMLIPKSGILQQMRWEQEAADALGLPWDVRVFGPADGDADDPIRVHADPPSWRVPGRVHRVLAVRRAYYRWLLEAAPRHDLILLRHAMADPMEAGFIARCPVPVVTVHHTLEVPELSGQGGFLPMLKARVESWTGRRAISAAAGVVGVTDEVRRYERQRAAVPPDCSWVYPNGVSPEAPVADRRSGDVPRIVFVANTFSNWHGLDLLLQAVEASGEQFELHLVGAIREADRHKVECDSRIVCHGRLERQDLNDLYSGMWIGLSSFGLHRNGMREACTLKVREYLASGLPVYSGHRDVFPDSFPFYRSGPADMADILNFARAMRTVSRERIAGDSADHISKSQVLERLYRSLQGRFTARDLAGGS